MRGGDQMTEVLELQALDSGEPTDLEHEFASLISIACSASK
jgi:hypothetical protein